MWIKHNKALYNALYISRIEVARTKLVATFNDGEKITIGEFRAMQEAEDILRSITRALVSDDPDHPGIIIRDTKVPRKKKEEEE